MKAVILAGGEGTRLRPLSAGRPKPMVSLLDRPLLEHLLQLLRENGITEICATLHFMPEQIASYFGDGTAFGVHLTWFVEDAPRGTAGSVKNCAGFLGADDFLVISGDAVCDLDLRACIRFHRERRAEATLVLHRSAEPLEYGLVLTDKDGAVRRFVEKPAWSQVVTDRVNTGIYILSPQVLEAIPSDEACDFGRDVFPRLLRQGRRLFGYEAEGYWCDVGDCGAYLKCTADVLSGGVRLTLPVEQRHPGIWSAEPVPENVTLLPPCYIGKGAVLGEGCVIGPYTAVGAGSTVGCRAVVRRSVLQGAFVGADARLESAILCAGSVVRDGAVLEEGAVLGEKARVGAHAVIGRRVRLWPEKEVPDGMRQMETVAAVGVPVRVRFGDGGVIRGQAGVELTPALGVSLGMAMAVPGGAAALAFCGGSAARLMVQSLGCGVCAGGAQAVLADVPCESAAAWAVRRQDWDSVTFVRQEGERLYLRLLGRDGLPLPRSRERKLEGTLQRGDQQPAAPDRIGDVTCVSGLALQYCREAAEEGLRFASARRPCHPAVRGTDACAQLLRSALGRMGAFLSAERSGIPVFLPEHGGLRLRAIDESGALLGSEQLQLLLCLIEFESGGRHVGLREGAPAAAEALARSYGARILRQGRDGETADALYRSQEFLRDAVFAACRICGYMAKTGESLRALTARLPRFRIEQREVPLQSERSGVMRRLAEEHTNAVPLQEGLRVQLGAGSVRILPLNRRAALRIIAEGEDSEMAEELCAVFERKVRQTDGRLRAGKS